MGVLDEVKDCETTQMEFPVPSFRQVSLIFSGHLPMSELADQTDETPLYHFNDLL